MDSILASIIFGAGGSGGGGGGTGSYADLTDKPRINDVELSNNKSLSDLGLYSKNEINVLLDDKVDDTDIVKHFGAPTSHSKIPSEKLVKDNLDNKQDHILTYTLAEYEAIKDSIEEGTIFIISNDKTQVTNAGTNKYSTDETICGEWIDGKPLYRKVVRCKMPKVITDGTYPSNEIFNLGDITMDYLSLIYSVVVTNNNGFTLYQPLPYINNSGRIAKAYTLVNNSTHIGEITCCTNGINFSELDVIAIVEYTKTTD